jgi:hypothetical protein
MEKSRGPRCNLILLVSNLFLSQLRSRPDSYIGRSSFAHRRAATTALLQVGRARQSCTIGPGEAPLAISFLDPAA